MMSSTNEEDPFLQVQADVLSTLTTTRSLFTSFLRIRSLSQSPTSPELLSARSEVLDSITTLLEDLADLTASVQAVQSDPYKYGLEIEEVSRRQRLVSEVSGEVEDMREELAKRDTQKPGIEANGKETGAGGGFREEEDTEDYTQEFEREQQLQMFREQDRDLDSVFHTVGNLRQQASDMGRELEEQTEMLETVDGLADRVGGRLQTGMKKMGEVVRAGEEKWSGLCVWLLVFALIILLVLVLVL